jgi:hypothetical protein
MHVRTHLILVVSLLAFIPAVASAGPESAALKTCTAAFASSLAVKGAALPAVTLKYLATQPSSAFAEYYTHDYTFFLKANDPRSGSPLARATCSATTGGMLLSLSATPLETGKATLAAQF